MKVSTKNTIALLTLGVSLGALNGAEGATALELVQKLGIGRTMTEVQAATVLKEIAANPANFEAIRDRQTDPQAGSPPPPPAPPMAPLAPPPASSAPAAAPSAGSATSGGFLSGLGDVKLRKREEGSPGVSSGSGSSVSTTPGTAGVPGTPGTSGTPGAADLAAQAKAKAESRGSISGATMATPQKIDRLGQIKDQAAWTTMVLEIVQAPDVDMKFFLDKVDLNRLKYLDKVVREALGTSNAALYEKFKVALDARVAGLKDMMAKRHYTQSTEDWS